jgi:hypothetical protein
MDSVSPLECASQELVMMQQGAVGLTAWNYRKLIDETQKPAENQVARPLSYSALVFTPAQLAEQLFQL